MSDIEANFAFTSKRTLRRKSERPLRPHVRYLTVLPTIVKAAARLAMLIV